MSRNKVLEITDCQQATLAEICQFIDDNGYPPTVQELADIFEVTAPSIHYRLKQLASKGYIRRPSGLARGLAVLKRPDEMTLKLTAIPLLGFVAAGSPIIAWENVLDEILVPQSIVGKAECFALSVQGDSMVNAHIHDGDTIVVRRQVLAESGDIVVAMIDDEATVKRLRIDSGIVQLLPENKKYKPILISTDTNFRIIGKVVANRH